MARRSDGAMRAILVEKALESFGDRGFRGTTIKRIADRAGVAPGSVYTYFKDKDELFRSTVDEGWNAFLGSLDDLAVSHGSFSRTVDRLLDAGFTELARRLPLVRGLVLEPGRSDFLREKVEELCRHVGRIFAVARSEGALKAAVDPAAWRAMLRVTVNGILFSAAIAPQGRAAAEMRVLKTAVRRMIAVRLEEGAAS